MDMNMPVMDGRDAYIKIHEINEDVKIILASGYADDNKIQDLFELGLQDFLPKTPTGSPISVRLSDRFWTGEIIRRFETAGNLFQPPGFSILSSPAAAYNAPPQAASSLRSGMRSSH